MFSHCEKKFFFIQMVEIILVKDVAFRVYVTQNCFINLFERAFKMMKNGVYFIVIALLVAELLKILVCAN